MITGNRTTGYVTGLVLTLFVFTMPVSGWAAEQVPLKYGWQKGQHFAYRVKIDVNREDFSEVLNGVEQYDVIKSDANSFSVRCSGKLSSVTKSKNPRSFISPLRMLNHRSPYAGLSSSMAGAFEQHVLELNRYGEIDTVKGSSVLPYLLGHLSQISLIPLSPEGKSEWSESEKTSVSILSSDRIRSPFRSANVEKTMGAKETTDYKITEQNGDEVTIAVTHSYRTVSTVNDKPEIELSGTGKIQFDQKQGAVKSLLLNYTMFRRSENTTHQIPITISSEQLSEEELTKFREAQEELHKKHLAEVKKREEAAHFEIPENIDADLKPILTELATKNVFQRKTALKKLSEAKPRNESPEVSAILIKLLNSKDISIVKDASEALVVWSTKEDIPAMIALLQEINFLGQENLIDAILKHKSPEGLDAVAKLMQDPVKAHTASKKLIDYGSDAEEPVLKLLEPSNFPVMVGVLRVLKEIGTEKTLTRIEEIKRTSDNRHFEFFAAETVKAVRARVAKSGN